MSELPGSSEVPVASLAAAFNNVTNSYKYYWFLAILQSVRVSPSRVVPIDLLLARMIASVWYPLHYYRLSFGKQDRLGKIAYHLRAEAPSLLANAESDSVVSMALQRLSYKSPLAEEIRSIGNYVPHRFLRVFFHSELRGVEDWRVNSQVVTLADTHFGDVRSPCLYRFRRDSRNSIELHPSWYEYLQEHLYILEGFCLWHLVNYLQKHNPNVPNIPGKLFRPEQRDLKQARAFWTLVLRELGEVICIYSHQRIAVNDFSLDHFLPWSFVAHDLLWNIIPTPKAVNSGKGDLLPNMSLYFDAFARLQYESLKVVASTRQLRLLEDYVLLLKSDSAADLSRVPFEAFHQVLYDTIVPQIQIARNMGFEGEWRYSTH